MSFTARSPCECSVTISCGFKAALVENGRKAAAFLLYQIWLRGQLSLTGSGAVRCKLEWNVPGEIPLCLLLITSCSYLFIYLFFDG